jgi:hypothetical protein
LQESTEKPGGFAPAGIFISGHFGLEIRQAVKGRVEGLVLFGEVQAHSAVTTVNGAETIVMGNAQFIRVIIYLVGSAVCLIAAAFINQQKSRALSSHLASLEKGKEAA